MIDVALVHERVIRVESAPSLLLSALRAHLDDPATAHAVCCTLSTLTARGSEATRDAFVAVGAASAVHAALSVHPGSAGIAQCACDVIVALTPPTDLDAPMLTATAIVSLMLRRGPQSPTLALAALSSLSRIPLRACGAPYASSHAPLALRRHSTL